jgi:hypothetical protein
MKWLVTPETALSLPVVMLFCAVKILNSNSSIFTKCTTSPYYEHQHVIQRDLVCHLTIHTISGISSVMHSGMAVPS